MYAVHYMTRTIHIELLKNVLGDPKISLFQIQMGFHENDNPTSQVKMDKINSMHASKIA